MRLKYKLRNIITGLKNLYVWAPIIWRDRDYDYMYTIEILKKKLELQAKCLDNGWMESSQRNAEIIRTVIRLMDKVYGEEYFDDMFTNGKLNEEYENRFDYYIQKEAKAKKLLYKILSDKLDSWWD